MDRVIDISGNRYGSLTVQNEFIYEQTYKSNGKKVAETSSGSVCAIAEMCYGLARII